MSYELDVNGGATATNTINQNSGLSNESLHIDFTLTNLKPYIDLDVRMGSIDGSILNVSKLTTQTSVIGTSSVKAQQEALIAWARHKADETNIVEFVYYDPSTSGIGPENSFYTKIEGNDIVTRFLSTLPWFQELRDRWYALGGGSALKYTKSTLGVPGGGLRSNENGMVSGTIIIPKSAVISYITTAGSLKIDFAEIEDPRYYGSTVATIEVPYRTTTTFTPEYTLPSYIGTSSSGVFAPLAQTFKVDSESFPLGLFLTSIELFFAAKGPLPVCIEIRPMDTQTGGVPDSRVIHPGTQVTVNSADVNVPTNPTLGIGASTKFNLKNWGAVYFPPGEYAICITSNSSEYSLYYGKQGEAILGRNLVDTVKKDPYVGRMFKAQGSSGWAEQQATDLCFVLNKAVFETTTEQGRAFVLQNYMLPAHRYNDLYLSTTTLEFGEIARIGYSYKGKGINGNDVSIGQINKNIAKHVDASSLYANATGDMKVTVTYFNSNKDLTPMMSINDTNMLTFKPSIDPYELDSELSELSYLSGVARSKYISQVVSLQDGFDSTGLEVKLDVNRVVATDISVYCRVISSIEIGPDASIENRDWRLMPLFNQRANALVNSSLTGVKTFAGADTTKFYTETYKILEGDSLATTGTPNLSYYANTGTSSSKFDSFSKFQVKVIFWSSDERYVPKIKNLIATAVI